MAAVRPLWDTQFMLHAHTAAAMSTCCRRQVGAVIVRERRLIASGFNGNVPGAVHCTDGGCSRCENRAFASGTAMETCVCVHAEANAVAQCARYGTAAVGGSIYTTHRPCIDCVKLVAVAGIVEVIYKEEYPGDYPIPPTLTIRKLA